LYFLGFIRSGMDSSKVYETIDPSTVKGRSGRSSGDG
jgi:hypothetical protein